MDLGMSSYCEMRIPNDVSYCRDKNKVSLVSRDRKKNNSFDLGDIS